MENPKGDRLAGGPSQFPAFSLKDFHRIVKVAAGHEEKQPAMVRCWLSDKVRSMNRNDPMISYGMASSSYQAPLRNYVFFFLLFCGGWDSIPVKFGLQVVTSCVVNPGLINHSSLTFGGYPQKSDNLILQWYHPNQTAVWGLFIQVGN